MSRTGKWFWALVAAQLCFLLAWAGYHEVLRQHAPVLLLKARPVDPQDLLRGDYMTIAYNITEVDVVPNPAQGGFGRGIWVLLEKRDRYYVATQAAYEKLAPMPGQVLVRGTITAGLRSTGKERVEYGIEKYFVPEGKGTPRFNLMEVEVTVSPTHRLNLKRVLLDGKAFP
ncbi:MAG TPA: GDYXXLXY domain-containing protein [Lacunisphaera sp.]|nr:GDYXXLXY domain-containing protein [Lacunisphaera sp.]